MKYRSPFFFLPILFCLTFLSYHFSAKAENRVITNAPLDDKNKLLEYSFKLLELALDVTKKQYGEYSLARSTHAMLRDRQFTELIKGENLNVTISNPITRWNKKAIRVPFPTQKGISSYRIFFLLKKNKHIFKDIYSLDDLKKISTGSNKQWSVAKIFKHHQFNLVTGITYKGLFDMLNSERFISFNRGINEIFIELETFGLQFPELTYDKNIVLFTYLPNYFYVSPKFPELATRIEKGLMTLHNNGQLDELFYQYFGQYIDKMQLNNRRHFYIENNNLEHAMFEQDKPYLLDISKIDEKNKEHSIYSSKATSITAPSG
ncbi:MAG: hypothetical protein OCD00_05460 [Colwellia sp.]